jgi:hypothetical protein
MVAGRSAGPTHENVNTGRPVFIPRLRHKPAHPLGLIAHCLLERELRLEAEMPLGAA